MLAKMSKISTPSETVSLLCCWHIWNRSHQDKTHTYTHAKHVHAHTHKCIQMCTQVKMLHYSRCYTQSEAKHGRKHWKIKKKKRNKKLSGMVLVKEVSWKRWHWRILLDVRGGGGCSLFRLIKPSGDKELEANKASSDNRWEFSFWPEAFCRKCVAKEAARALGSVSATLRCLGSVLKTLDSHWRFMQMGLWW